MKTYNLTREYDPEILNRLHLIQLEMLHDIDSLCKQHNINYFGVWGTALGAVRHKGFIPWDDDLDIGMLRSDFERFLDVAQKEMSDKYYIMSPKFDEFCTSSVTKLVLRDSIFVSEVSRTMKQNQGIFIDIFPYDKVAPNMKIARAQQFFSMAYGRLLFLAGSGDPVISNTGVGGAIYAAICKAIHGALKITNVKAKSLFRKYEKWQTRYNKCENAEYITWFGFNNSLRSRFKLTDLFPMQSCSFEDATIPLSHNVKEMLINEYGDYMKLPPLDRRVNHAPYILKFPGEDPVIDMSKVEF